jgi:hypothetical protein
MSFITIENKVGPSKPTYGRGEMTRFEKIFRIPSSHVLETKFHSYGSGLPDRWIHVEYDDRGQFIAQYESRAHTNCDGVQTSDGWEKFDIDDVLITSEVGLPV